MLPIWRITALQHLRNAPLPTEASTKEISFNANKIMSCTENLSQLNAADFKKIREYINIGRYSDADLLLNSLPVGARNAEWNFLKGCVLAQKNWFYDAQKYFETACYMDPNNIEYRNALNSIRARAQSYGGGYRTSGGGGLSACDMCQGLICADCCCECCGGDLIRCC